MSGLVGDSHLKALEELISAFSVVKYAEESRLVVVTAQMGWGKTRVVQELYAHLASHQPSHFRYWPSTLVENINQGDPSVGGKHTFPDNFKVPADTEMTFMWWGLSCQPRQNGTLSNAVADNIGQLISNLDSIFRKLEYMKVEKALRKQLAGILFGAIPFSNAISLLVDLKDSPLALWQYQEAVRGRFKRDDKARTIDSSGPQEELLERWVPALVSALELAEIPLVVFLDDVHWADPTTVDFLDRLLRASSTTLVVATAWPEKLHDQKENLDRLDAGSFIQRWEDRLSSIELAQLTETELAQVAGRALGVPVDSSIATQLGQRAGNNPLMLRIWAGCDPVVRAATGGRPLSVTDLKDLPDDAWAAYHSRWKELSGRARLLLAAGAEQGFEFVPQVVDETLLMAGLEDGNADTASGALDDIHWVQAIGSDVYRFAELTLHEVADSATSTLGHAERTALRNALCTTLEELKASDGLDRLSDQAQSAVLGAHIRATNPNTPGHASDSLEHVINSYNRLALIQPSSLIGWTEAARLWDEAIHRLDTAGGEHLDLRRELTDRYATSLYRMGRPLDALPLLESNLSDRVSNLGPDHGDTQTSRNNLATCLQELGQFEVALPHFEAIFLHREATLGQRRLRTLDSRNNWAGCLLSAGRAEDALPHFQEVLEGRSMGLGPKHLDTAISSHNLAGCLTTMNRADEALPLFERAAKSCEANLGATDPTTLVMRKAYHVCLGLVHQSNESIVSLQQVLADLEHVLGPDHPDTLMSRYDIAQVLLSLDQPLKALEMLERQLGGCEVTFGPTHALTIASRATVVSCLKAVDRPDEAVPHSRLILAYYVDTLGPDHPDAAAFRVEHARLLMMSERGDEGLPHFERVLTQRLVDLGPSHLDTLACRRDLAFCLGVLGRDEEALPHFQLVLAECEAKAGFSDPITLSAAGELALCLQRLGLADDAIPHLERALAGFNALFGPDHPYTAAHRDALITYGQDALGPTTPDLPDSRENGSYE